MQAILVINKQTHSIIHCCLKEKTRSCSLSCSFCCAVGEGVGPLQSTHPSLGLNASLSSWRSCAASKTSTCSDSWRKNKYLYMHTKRKRPNQMRNKIRCWWLSENGRERQEGGSGSRGVTALTERCELPGWLLRCGITCKHDQAESAKRGRQEQQMLRLVN